MHGTPEEETEHLIGSVSMDPFGLIDILGTYFPQQLFTVDDTWLNLTSALLSFFSSPPGQNLVSQVQKLDFLQLQQICHVEELYKMLTEKPKIALLYECCCS
ncbi:hypothetical protein AAZX31_03G158800 [Glycine max]